MKKPLTIKQKKWTQNTEYFENVNMFGNCSTQSSKQIQIQGKKGKMKNVLEAKKRITFFKRTCQNIPGQKWSCWVKFLKS